MDAKLYVGHVAPVTTAQDLRTLFSQAGPVVSVQLRADHAAPAPRSAQVTMASRAAAQKAIDLFQRVDLAGSELVVRFAPARQAAVAAQGQLSAFGQAERSGQTKLRKPGQARTGHQSALGAFGSGPSAPTPPRRRGGSQRH